jgi:hypothetical protein
MNSPFPGMNPYLEHPSLWEGVHARLIVSIANQLQPLLDPRYVATVEERVFIEGPQQRIPDVWIQKTDKVDLERPQLESVGDTALVVEVKQLEIHQRHVEIRDAYNDMKLVSLIELLSPSNKRPGPGQQSYLEKQREVLERDCHLVEIDLLRDGDRVVSIPQWKLFEFERFDYVACVSRWPHRTKFEVYPRRLQERLPRLAVPLADPDPDIPLDIQLAVEQVYSEGRYARRLRYEQPCHPALDDELQAWVNQCLNQS